MTSSLEVRTRNDLSQNKQQPNAKISGAPPEQTEVAYLAKRVSVASTGYHALSWTIQRKSY